jgi:hypothetical protein
VADYDTSHLLSLIRDHTRIPGTTGYSDADCLRVATAELHSSLLPMVKAQRQEMWLSSEATTYVVPLTEGQSEYQLPARAVGAGARKATLVRASPTREVSPLRWYEVEQVEEWSSSPGFPTGYTVRGNRLVLYPTPQNVSGWSLRVPFHVRPGRLVSTEECGEVESAVEGGVGLINVTLTSDALTALNNATVVDVVRGSAPFDTVRLEALCSFTSPTTLEMYGVEASELSMGDYICLPGTSPFPQLPVELHPLLAHRVAMRQLTSIQDLDAAGAVAALLPEERKDAALAITPRVEGEDRKPQNGMGKWRGRWRY